MIKANGVATNPPPIIGKPSYLQLPMIKQTVLKLLLA
jgi:hypothetical protein